MVEQEIEFRKIRDFGENLNDTFLFIRQNFKPLIISFFSICGLFYLAQAIVTGLYLSRVLTVFGQLRNSKFSSPRFSDIIPPQFILVILFGWVTYAAMKVTLASYIKYYAENNGAKPGIEDIWKLFRKYFFKVFLYSIPILIITVIGYLFCFFPGIYLTIVLMPFELILITENSSFGAAWDRCFIIIKENFWSSFVIYLVSGLIYGISGEIISFVISSITGLGSLLTSFKLTPMAGIATSFLEIFSSVFFIIFYVSVALNYFSLAEQRDGTGILNRIGKIGDNKNNFDNIEEQY